MIAENALFNLSFQIVTVTLWFRFQTDDELWTIHFNYRCKLNFTMEQEKNNFKLFCWLIIFNESTQLTRYNGNALIFSSF